ncbi:hypothetical protein AIN02nite_22810 [Acetobacter indonesiensis]|uniref:Uncharacterized protein n=1 Tax=Acetobacter indonesiensis TaxID=104101 RepID=A0A6N3T4T6_9PROT|nr:hypothetical protein AIN02nite_22810 [Acetobacter indonesiensis]
MMLSVQRVEANKLGIGNRHKRKNDKWNERQGFSYFCHRSLPTLDNHSWMSENSFIHKKFIY